MATLRFKNARIAGVTCSFPQQRVTTEQIASRLNVDANKVASMTGIVSRRIAPSKMCASDYCFDSANRLLDELGWERASVGALIFVTQTPDYFLPATACILQERLGLGSDCVCFDINMGCSGYVYGLSVAFSFLQSGVKRIMLLVGDTLSRFVSDDDASVAFLFGDSGSATAIDECEQEFSTFVLGTDGSGAKKLIVPAGKCRIPASTETLRRVNRGKDAARSEQELAMNGAEVMAFTLREVPKLFNAIQLEAGITVEDVSFVVMHQANQFLLDNLQRKLEIPYGKVPSSLKEFGNTSCASIPVTITEAMGNTISREGCQVVLLGFGVGWSWGACHLSLNNVVMPPSNFLT